MEEQNASEQLQEITQPSESSNQDNSLVEKINILSSKNRKIGLYLIIWPFIGVILALIGVVIVNAVKALLNIETAPVSLLTIFLNFFNWILILVGILSIIGFIISIPIGIMYLCKRDIVDGIDYDARSGNGEQSIIPVEIKGWSWGAAGLTWIWGISHGVWISLLAFIPILNIFMWIFLGVKGNEMAWKSQKWKSVEEFNSYQKKWRPWGIAFFIIGILASLSKFISK
jgi:hypothetical protein